MTTPCFKAAAQLQKDCGERLECAGVASWPWAKEVECFTGNAFIAWELTCCGKEPSKDLRCLEIPRCDPTPREAGLLLLLLRCRRRPARDVAPAQLELVGSEGKEIHPGAPPAHWGGLQAGAFKPKAQEEPKPRKLSRVTFRKQDSVMEFTTSGSQEALQAPETIYEEEPLAPAAQPASGSQSAAAAPETSQPKAPAAQPASGSRSSTAAPLQLSRGETITAGSLEEEVILWVEAISGDSKGEETFGKWLKDGRVLCKVANIIKPGIIPNVNTSKMPFKQMENVTAFIKACRTLGVLEKDVFSTVDLFEAKNLTSVQRCIFNLGSVVRRTAPDFPGPFLGVVQNAKVGDKKRESQVLTQYTGLRQDIADELRTGHNVRVAGQAP